MAWKINFSLKHYRIKILDLTYTRLRTTL